MGIGGEPGDHRNAEPVQVIGKLVQLGTIDAGIDQDQPMLPAHHDGIGPDSLTLLDPDAVGHEIQGLGYDGGKTILDDRLRELRPRYLPEPRLPGRKRAR